VAVGVSVGLSVRGGGRRVRQVSVGVLVGVSDGVLVAVPDGVSVGCWSACPTGERRGFGRRVDGVSVGVLVGGPTG